MRAPPPTQSLVIIAAGYALGGFALYWGLPEQATSWTASGRAPFWLAPALAAFLLPTAMVITNLLLRSLCLRHHGDDAGTMEVAIYDAIMRRFTAFVIGMHAMIMLGMLGWLSNRAWVAQIVPVMAGLTMISIGNLLPRTRPNLAIGIRTRRTLSDRGLWIKTHRTAGYVLVLGGAVVVLSALAIPTPAVPAMAVLLAPAALVGSWFLRWSGKGDA